MTQHIDTNIMTVGKAKIENPAIGPYVDDTPVPFYLDVEHAGEDAKGLDAPLFLEQAGPRSHVYYDPGKTKAAVVTCGGLCPGLNDVIRAIVLESYYGYGVRSILGIRYGLEGFIPKYHHDIMELTPRNVSEIHSFGGTILGSSRGPQSSEEIVDALERMNVNMLYIIGGDGTMKA
ncbi:MAG: 6-phosphofructokinase, partial [Mailhella sp.]|nr:6-phosphofructokinase [Mailhella sp.]